MLLWSVEDAEGRTTTEAVPLTLDGAPRTEPRWVAPTQAFALGEVSGSGSYLAIVEGGLRRIDRDGASLESTGWLGVRARDVVGRGPHFGLATADPGSGTRSWETHDGEGRWQRHDLDDEVFGISIADRESSGADAWILTRGNPAGLTILDALFDADAAPTISTRPVPEGLSIDNAAIGPSSIALGVRGNAGPQLALFSEAGLTEPVDVGGEIWQVHSAHTERHEGMVATVQRADGSDSTWEVHVVIRGDDFDRWHSVVEAGLPSTRAVVVGVVPLRGDGPDFLVAWPDPGAGEPGVVIQPIGCSCFRSP